MAERSKQYKGYTEKKTKQYQDFSDLHKQLKARMTAEKRDLIKAHARAMKESANEFAVRAVKETLEREADTDGTKE